MAYSTHICKWKRRSRTIDRTPYQIFSQDRITEYVFELFGTCRVTIIIGDDDDDDEPVPEATVSEIKPDVEDPEDDDSDVFIINYTPAKRRKLSDSDKMQSVCGNEIKKCTSPIVKSERFDVKFHEFSSDTSELFCRSLIPTLKRLNKCAKSVARLMIQRTLHTVQFGNPSDAVATEIQEMIRSAQSGMQESKGETSVSPDRSLEKEDKLFCLSLAPTLREMNKEKQSLAKFKIQEVLHKCQF